jgi:hypothetical protein
MFTNTFVSDWWDGKIGFIQTDLKACLLDEDRPLVHAILRGDTSKMQSDFMTDMADWVGQIVADAARSFAPHVQIYKVLDITQSNAPHAIWKVTAMCSLSGLNPSNNQYAPFICPNWKNHYDLLVHRVELNTDNFQSF